MIKGKKKATRPFTRAGSHLDDMLGDTTQRIEEETQKLIAYINDEVVPAIREHSTTALRIAADKMKQAADMMEAGNRRKRR